jgi:uncharacterized protein YggE
MKLLGIILAITGFASAQVMTRRPYVRASGEGVVSVKPDQATINVGVITQGLTAAAATDSNATKAEAILEAVRRLLGANADIRTAYFSVTPNQRFPQGGGVPEIVGYTATNNFRVVIADTSSSGRVIDAATAAGANTVGGIVFGVRDPAPLRQQALRMATQQARANAEAIATGMSSRLGVVISAAESSVATPIRGGDFSAAPGLATTTPVEAGNLEVRATVTIEVEVLP